jgi:hypothetical protein
MKRGAGHAALWYLNAAAPALYLPQAAVCSLPT